jgi:Spy/CpxP family protein refolding chaperone
MTRKRVAIIIVALAVTVGVGLAVNEFASAQGRGWGAGPGFFGGGPGFGGHMGIGGGPLISRALALKNELKLNENQVTKLEQLRTDFYKKAANERIEMQALRLELQKLYLADKLDVAAAEKQLRAIEKKRTDLQIERLKAIEQAKEVLTPEQLKQLETYGFGSRFGRGGFGPGGMMGPGGGMMGPRGGMGPGMMGQGYGRGWGMGPGWGWGTQTPAAPPTQQQ